MTFIGRSLGSVGGLRSGRRLAAVATAGLALAWSLKLLVELLAVHTAAPCELPGVFVALAGIAAGSLSVALLVGSRRRPVPLVAAFALWVAVGLGGIGGSIEHLAGEEPGRGPVDTRPRPPLAPLVFTGIGVAGAAALLVGERRPREDVGQ